MNSMKCLFSVIVLLFICPFFHFETVHADQTDSFYKDFLIQRMMIAKIREFRGDVTAKALLMSLANEAKNIGMKLPKWSRSEPLEGPFKYNSGVREKKINTNFKRYNPLIYKASRTYDLPPALVKAVIHTESAFVNDAISHKGAQGLMQLMPGTADEIGVKNAFDPRANIFGGSKLLRRYLNEFGSLKKSLIAYNAGPEWVRKRKGLPKETRTYIRRVINYYHAYKRQI